MIFVLVLFAIFGGAKSLHAQTLAGTVTEQESGAALSGVFIVLLDSAGTQRNATLTRDDGTYVIRAPYAGRFSVRAELIGHETAGSTLLDVVSGDATRADIRLPIAAIELEALNVAGDRRCVARPGADGQSARLWEEARKALTVAKWTEKERIARFQIRHYDRELRLGSLAVVWEGVRKGYSDVRPYRAVSPDSLAQFGFVRTISADSTLYYGPDAEVLLSDAFRDAHCFYATRGTDESHGLAGLAFEPVQGRKLPDIKGTLWLDPQTSELKYIEYTYTGIGKRLNVRGVGGRTYFRRLPNGAWIVDRWFIRMPMPRRDRGGELVAGGILEGGGEIVDVRVSGVTLPSATVSGAVYDSVHHSPLRYAFVYLSGTSHSTVTDSAGRFTITNVTAGTYLIGFSHESFDSLPALPRPVQIGIDARGDTDVQIAVPSMTTMIASLCADAHEGAAIAGEVTKDGYASGDATVTAGYRNNGRQFNVSAKTDTLGHYVLCGLPTGTSIVIKVNSAAPKRVIIPDARFVRVDLEVE